MHVMNKVCSRYLQFSGVVVPSTFGRDRKQTGGGVWTSDQAAITNSLSVGRLRNLATAADIELVRQTLPSAIFAGYAINHFGHFLTESIGRLPNIPSMHSAAPIIFLAGNRKSRVLQPWQSELLRVVGCSREVSVIDEATFVQELVVPDISFHQNKVGYGDKAGTQWRDAVFPKSSRHTGGKIYVSRSQLDASLGRYQNEQMLETALRTYGFQIIHPQNMTIEAQVSVYKQASHIVLAESSAIHLLNLVCGVHQKIALIQRRPKIHSSIRRASRYFSRAQVVGINAISKFVGEDQHARPEYRGTSEVDFELVLSVLAELSFVQQASFSRAPRSTLDQNFKSVSDSSVATLLSRTWEQ